MLIRDQNSGIISDARINAIVRDTHMSGYPLEGGCDAQAVYLRLAPPWKYQKAAPYVHDSGRQIGQLGESDYPILTS